MKKLLLFIIVCALIAGAYVYMGNKPVTTSVASTSTNVQPSAKLEPQDSTNVKKDENINSQISKKNEIAQKESAVLNTAENNETVANEISNSVTPTENNETSQETNTITQTKPALTQNSEDNKTLSQEPQSTATHNTATENTAAQNATTKNDTVIENSNQGEVAQAQNNGISIDTENTKVIFEAYKMPNKLKVPETGGYATFKNVKFNFANTSGSVADILTNATANVDLSSIDTQKNSIRDNNVKTKFFQHLSSVEANAKITAVNGDDNSGEIKLLINFNNVDKEVSLSYEVKDGKIIALGTIDLQNDFNAKDAFEKFASDPVIAGLHGKKSWSIINLGFEITLK